MSTPTNDKYLNEVGRFNGITNNPTSGWFGESREGKTFIRIPLTVTDEGMYKGKMASWIGWLNSPENEDKTTKRLTEVYGFDGDYKSLNEGRQTFADKPVNFETEIETYNNKQQCRVKWLNPAGGRVAKKPIDSAKLDSLLGRLTSRGKATAKVAAQETGTPIVRQAAPANAAAADKTPEEDDVPF